MKPDPAVRGSGMTTKQIKDAPQGAVFVWCNQHRDYPRCLAVELGRGDLKIETPEFFTGHRWRGLRGTDIVIDHALDPHSFPATWRAKYFEVMAYLQATR